MARAADSAVLLADPARILVATAAGRGAGDSSTRSRRSNSAAATWPATSPTKPGRPSASPCAAARRQPLARGRPRLRLDPARLDGGLSARVGGHRARARSGPRFLDGFDVSPRGRSCWQPSSLDLNVSKTEYTRGHRPGSRLHRRRRHLPGELHGEGPLRSGRQSRRSGAAAASGDGEAATRPRAPRSPRLLPRPRRPAARPLRRLPRPRRHPGAQPLPRAVPAPRRRACWRAGP